MNKILIFILLIISYSLTSCFGFGDDSYSSTSSTINMAYDTDTQIATVTVSSNDNDISAIKSKVTVRKGALMGDKIDFNIIAVSNTEYQFTFNQAIVSRETYYMIFQKDAFFSNTYKSTEASVNSFRG